MNDTGLVKQDCIHAEHRQEYISTAWGEMAHRCLGCGETILVYIECQGG